MQSSPRVRREQDNDIRSLCFENVTLLLGCGTQMLFGDNVFRMDSEYD